MISIALGSLGLILLILFIVIVLRRRNNSEKKKPEPEKSTPATRDDADNLSKEGNIYEELQDVNAVRGYTGLQTRNTDLKPMYERTILPGNVAKKTYEGLNPRPTVNPVMYTELQRAVSTAASKRQTKQSQNLANPTYTESSTTVRGIANPNYDAEDLTERIPPFTLTVTPPSLKYQNLRSDGIPVVSGIYESISGDSVSALSQRYLEIISAGSDYAPSSSGYVSMNGEANSGYMHMG